MKKNFAISILTIATILVMACNLNVSASGRATATSNAPFAPFVIPTTIPVDYRAAVAATVSRDNEHTWVCFDVRIFKAVDINYEILVNGVKVDGGKIEKSGPACATGTTNKDLYSFEVKINGYLVASYYAGQNPTTATINIP